MLIGEKVKTKVSSPDKWRNRRKEEGLNKYLFYYKEFEGGRKYWRKSDGKKVVGENDRRRKNSFWSEGDLAGKIDSDMNL